MHEPYPNEPAAGVSTLMERYPNFLTDPNDFIPFLFSNPEGKPFHQAEVHRALQIFLTAHRRALIELPRDHGKTTQICGRILWELARAPGLRVKVVCATDAVAVQRGQFLRDTVAANAKLKTLFPALAPGRPWSAESFTLNRTAGVLGPSVSSFGIGAGATGTRADLLVCDDIVDVRAMYGRANRERVRTDFENNLLNLLEPDGRFWGLYTPWHRDDLNEHLKKNPAFAVFRRAIDDALTPVWPEKWPTDALAVRRAEIGEAAFARGYRLLPVAEGETKINPEWLKTWHPPAPEFERIVMAIDPAVGTRTTADTTGIVVLGKADGVVYCLNAKAYRKKLPDLIPIINDADLLWQPGEICFESNAAFKGIADYLATNPYFGHKIRPRPATGAKEQRISVLSVRIERGEFLLKGTDEGEVDASQKALFAELTSFPFGEHDDLADATAAGTAFLFGDREPRVW